MAAAVRLHSQSAASLRCLVHAKGLDGAGAAAVRLQPAIAGFSGKAPRAFDQVSYRVLPASTSNAMANHEATTGAWAVRTQPPGCLVHAKGTLVEAGAAAVSLQPAIAGFSR